MSIVSRETASAQVSCTERGEDLRAPHISIVAVSRNDDHGGDLLGRMQHFVDGLVAQCRRHGLSAELILVEWNPPADRPPLAEVLRWPEDPEPCAIRIVTVPPELHARLSHAQELPLFQMIAKNVAIRHARGDFVLATNIDILFSDAMIRFMRDELRPGRVYRVDRYDVPPELPEAAPLEDVLAWCETSAFRINRRDGIYLIKERKLYPIYQTVAELIGVWTEAVARRVASFPLGIARGLFRGLRKLAEGLVLPGRWSRFARALGRGPRLVAEAAFYPGWGPRFARAFSRGFRRMVETVSRLRPPSVARAFYRGWRSLAGAARRAVGRVVALFGTFTAALREILVIPRLHTNACGDFTLMSRQDWFDLRGYPEWQIFSWHIDSVLLHQAYGNGLPVVEIPDPSRIYHIEHGVGSGWTPDGEDTLFARIEKAGIPYMSHADFVQVALEIRTNAKAKRATRFNAEDWGLADEALRERKLGRCPSHRATV